MRPAENSAAADGARRQQLRSISLQYYAVRGRAVPSRRSRPLVPGPSQKSGIYSDSVILPSGHRRWPQFFLQVPPNTAVNKLTPSCRESAMPCKPRRNDEASPRACHGMCAEASAPPRLADQRRTRLPWSDKPQRLCRGCQRVAIPQRCRWRLDCLRNQNMIATPTDSSDQSLGL